MIRTTKNKVIISPKFVSSVSDSGIFIGEGEMKNEGTVICIGPDVLDINVGDVVVFDTNSGRQSMIRSEKVLILPDTDVIAVLDK